MKVDKSSVVPKARILLIDDDPLVLRTLSRVLEGERYETTAVDSGTKAIGMVKNEDYDLVLSDIRMPEIDGVETVKIIEEHHRHHGKSCAYMFITAYPDDQRTKEMSSSGRAKLMLKPFEIDDLLGLIQLELQAHLPSARREFAGE